MAPTRSVLISIRQARAILRRMKLAPSCADCILLTSSKLSNEAKERIRQILAAGALRDGQSGYQGVQFHGEESPDDCRGWGIRVIKAFRLKDKDSLNKIQEFPVDYYLLDSWSAGYGGSGASFPWEWLEGFDTGKVILSGGLNLDNVADAIRRLHPYAVDVCSGVEVRPGVKDHEKIKHFIRAAKEAA